MLIKNYSDFSLKTPGCHPGEVVYVANFKLDADVRALFPYINAVGQNSIYFDKAQTIQFTLEGTRCSISPELVHASKFEEREHALKFAEKLIEYLNKLDQRKDIIEPDFTPFKPVPVIDIFKLLPRTNCKDCGYSTCMAFAAALSKGETSATSCSAMETSDGVNAEKLQALFN